MLVSIADSDRASKNLEQNDLIHRIYRIYNIFVNYIVEFIIILTQSYTSLTIFQVFSTLNHVIRIACLKVISLVHLQTL